MDLAFPAIDPEVEVGLPKSPQAQQRQARGIRGASGVDRDPLE